MRHPLYSMAIILCAGISCQRYLSIPFVFSYIPAAVLLIFCAAFLRNQKRFDVFVCCFVFLLGFAVLANTKYLPRNHISNLIGYKQDECSIRGVVNERFGQNNNATSFILKAQELYSNNFIYSCSGLILARARGEAEIQYGDKLFIRGRLRRLSTGKPGKGFVEYLNSRGIYTVMDVSGPVAISRIGIGRHFSLRAEAEEAKSKAEKILFLHVPGVCAGIMDAMVLGEKKYITPVIKQAMTNSGTIHILVVSGFNVGIVAFVIFLLLKMAHVSRRWRIIIAVPVLLFYCFITGASNPVTRATIMAMVYMFSYFFKRDADIYNSLAVAACIILSFNPIQLFDIGFQLSFSSVIAMVYFYPKIKQILSSRRLKQGAVSFLIDSAIVSLSAWLGTMGFIAYYFKFFSPITVVANIVIVPLATLVTLCGFSLLISKFACPFLVPFFAHSSQAIVSLLVYANHILAKIPGSYLYWGK